jgi:hypothetical protein
VFDPGRAVGADLPEVCQTTPRDTGCSTTSPWVAKAVELRRCGATRGRLRGRVWPALPSHGRSHRFDPCHAHQHKRLPGTLLRRRLPADCQQTTLSRRQNDLSAVRMEDLGSPSDCRPCKPVPTGSRPAMW